MLKAWLWLKRHPLYGIILFALLLLGLQVAPLHPEVCSSSDNEKTLNCIAHSLLWWLFYYMNRASETIAAFATVAIAVFTVTLKDASIAQSELTRKAIQLARDEFNATHRPRIKVQSFQKQDDGTLNGTSGSVWLGIINAGEADAKIISWNCRIYLTDLFGSVVCEPDPDFLYRPAGVVLSPGETILIDVKCPRYTFENAEFTTKGGHRLFAIGRVTYSSAENIERVTGFHRECSSDGVKWDRVKDSDYEYEY